MSKPFISPSAKAADFFDANGNSMVGAVPDVVLLHAGRRVDVTTPWQGEELVSVDVVYSQWYKALIGRLKSSGNPRYEPSAFVIIFPQDTTVEEAERCVDVYMTLLNLVRQEQHS